MKVARGLLVSLRFGLTLALLSVLAWLLVFLLPPLSSPEFSELEARRNAEVAKRMAGEYSFWNHQPQILAARQVGPFVNPAFSLLTLATFPAVVTATRQAQPALCVGLPLLKQESWLAFFLVLVYSFSMWLVVGTLIAGVFIGLRRGLRRSPRVSPGAG